MARPLAYQKSLYDKAEIIKKILESENPAWTTLETLVNDLRALAKVVLGSMDEYREFVKLTDNIEQMIGAAEQLQKALDDLSAAQALIKSLEGFRPSAEQADCHAQIVPHLTRNNKALIWHRYLAVTKGTYVLLGKMIKATSRASKINASSLAVRRLDAGADALLKFASTLASLQNRMAKTDVRAKGLQLISNYEETVKLWHTIETTLSYLRHDYRDLCQTGLKPIIDRAIPGFRVSPPTLPGATCYALVVNPWIESPPPLRPAPDGRVTASPLTKIRAGESLALGGIASNADSLKIVFSQPQVATEAIGGFNKGAGTWTLSRRMDQAGDYAYTIVAVGAGEAVIFRGVLRVDNAQSSEQGRSPPSILSIGMTPREVTAGQPVKFSVQSSAPVKSVRLVFDQLTGGAPLELSDLGRGTDWARETPVNSAGPPGSNFQRSVWAIATALDGKEISPFGPVALTVRPALQDGMAFESETVPDNTLLASRQTFEKTWKVKNTGTRPWSTTHCLRPISGDSLGSTAVCVSGTVEPGSSYVFKVPMQAPAALAANATYKQSWRLTSSNTSAIGPDLWAQVVVRGSGVGNDSATASFSQQSTATVGQAWNLEVNTSEDAAGVNLVIGSEPVVPFTMLSPRRFTVQRVFPAVGRVPFVVRARFQRSPAQDFSGQVTVVAQSTVSPPGTTTAPSPGTTTVPPLPLMPTLTKSDVVQINTPWVTRLTTNIPVHSADLVFKSGRRIVFDGGGTNWHSRDGDSSRFSEAGIQEYEIQIRRTASATLETFGGYRLQVQAPSVPAIIPSITSALTHELGKAYNLTVQTNAAADRVMVRWPDMQADQGLKPLNAQKTVWEFGNRIFAQAQPQVVHISTYKDGIVQPLGTLTATINVVIPAATLRLASIQPPTTKGDNAWFTVATSPGVARVSAQVASDAAVDLPNTGASGAEQVFKGQVPIRQAGSVPYAIAAYNQQGQMVGTRLAGSLSVPEPGASLRVTNPVPASIEAGQAVDWIFATDKNLAESWLEFPAPIGRLNLVGQVLRTVINFPSGSYAYRMMGKDSLGNTFAVAGASGTLQIKPKAVLGISGITVNGQAVQAGSKTPLQVKLTSPLSVQAIAAGAKGLVLKLSMADKTTFHYLALTSRDGSNWSYVTPGGGTLDSYFRGSVKPSMVSADIYLGTGGVSNKEVNLGGTQSFTIQLVP